MHEAAEASAGMVERLPGWVVPALLIGVPLLAVVLGQVSDWFYANVIWKYYWGPIVADAQGVSPRTGLDYGGVTAYPGYNLVNTGSWAVLLGICIVGLAQLLNRFKTIMDSPLIIAASTWVVAGSVWHVVEDVGLFEAPLQYIFITPPIYLLFGAFGVLSFLIGHYLRFVAEQTDIHRALQKLWFIMALGVLLWTYLAVEQWDMIGFYVSPLWVAGFAAIGFFAIRWRVVKTGRIDPAEMTLMLVIPCFLMAMLYVQQFLDGAWGAGPGSNAFEPAWWAAPLGAAAVAGLVYVAAGPKAKAGSAGALAFRRPINLVLIFSQALDGLATAFGIDLRGYVEKHVLSEGVRRGFERLADGVGWAFGAEHPTFLAFFPLKVLVAMGVVYMIDVYSKEDAMKYPTFIGLVKFAIIMVGLGPGVRNMVRLSMGV